MSKKIYAIGVGGSGAKCIEAVTFLHAIGIYGANCELNTLLIDADSTNGNLTRTQQNIERTKDYYALFGQGFSNFMSKQINHWGTWNPLGDFVDMSFEEMLEFYYEDPLQDIFQVLYEPQEREMNFDVGFRGRPPVGSAILGTLKIESDTDQRRHTPLDKMLFEIDGGADYSIHLFGSIFGGTGAAGVPSLAKLIHDRFKNNNEKANDNKKANIEINASILLPYFGFDRPPAEEKVFAEKRFFKLNTQAALKFLHHQSMDKSIFKNIYLIGDSLSKKYTSKTGGEEQNNDAHFVELYAALAIKDVIDRPVKKAERSTLNDTQVYYICRGREDALTWGDFPDDDWLKQRLGSAVRVAYMWSHNFSLELKTANKLGPKKFAIGAPWLPQFFDISKVKTVKRRVGDDTLPKIGDNNQVKCVRAFDAWANALLVWAKQISKSHDGGDRLFNLNKANQSSGDRPYREKLSEIVIDQTINSELERQDCIDTIKNELADLEDIKTYGVVGLVHTLFTLAEI